MSRENSHPLLARLKVILDAYGPKQERWPPAERAKLTAFIERDRAAAKLYTATCALDNVLAFAPRARRPSPVKARVVALAAAPPPGACAVIAFPRRTGSVALRGEMRRQSGRLRWPQLTVFAASLVLGLAIGLSGKAVPALQNIALIAGEDSRIGAIAGRLFDPRLLPGQGAL